MDADNITLERRWFRDGLQRLCTNIRRIVAVRDGELLSQAIYQKELIFEDDPFDPPRFLAWFDLDRHDRVAASMQKWTNIFLSPEDNLVEEGRFEGLLWVPVGKRTDIPPIFARFEPDARYENAWNFMRSIHRNEVDCIQCTQLRRLYLQPSYGFGVVIQERIAASEPSSVTPTC